MGLVGDVAHASADISDLVAAATNAGLVLAGMSKFQVSGRWCCLGV